MENFLEPIETEEILLNNETEEDDITSDTKLERYQINSFTIDRSVETLIKWARNDKLIVPKFQREYVWSFANSSRFIESILLSLPVPPVFLFRTQADGVEKFLLIDGMQRMTTLEQFQEGTWLQGEKKRNFKLSSSNDNWNKKMFKDLSVNDQEFFNDYPIMTTVFEGRGIDETQEKNAIFSIFERINTGSEKLSDQEIRNAIFSGNCLTELQELAKTPSFNNLISEDYTIKKREKFVELMLRLVTYTKIYEILSHGQDELVKGKEETKVTTSKKIMLNNYLLFCQSGKIDYTLDFKAVLEAINVIEQFDNTAFYMINKENCIGNKIQELFAEALVISVIQNDYKINITKDEFINNKIMLWSDDSLIGPFKYKTTSKESILKMVEILLSWIM